MTISVARARRSVTPAYAHMVGPIVSWGCAIRAGRDLVVDPLGLPKSLRRHVVMSTDSVNIAGRPGRRG